MSFSNGLGELGLGEMGGHRLLRREDSADLILYNTVST